MCFTPIISLSTAIIEFLLGSILLIYFRKTKLRNFFALFIFALGFYQFSEFMICTTSYSTLWATIGIITYSFLPALGLHATLRIFDKGSKQTIWLVYLVPFLVAFTSLMLPEFVLRAECTSFFVSISTVMTQGNSWIHSISYALYLLYYAGFILASCWIIYLDFMKQKNKVKRHIELVELTGIILMTVPTFVFLIVLPGMGVMFPSILCEFAIFVAMAAFIGAYLEQGLYYKKK